MAAQKNCERGESLHRTWGVTLQPEDADMVKVKRVGDFYDAIGELDNVAGDSYKDPTTFTKCCVSDLSRADDCSQSGP